MIGRLVYALATIAGSGLLLGLGGCGGGGGGGSSAPPSVVNSQAIVVDAGPADTINLAFTTVTICTPGSSTSCQTIDHVQVDTGSSGLRILSSVLNAGALALPAQTDASGNAIVECMQFVDGFSWGPLKLADVKLAGESAGSVPIQVIGDPAFGAIPSNCASTGPPENTVAQFGANGILGVSAFLQDCGPACAATSSVGFYYACPATGACVPTTVATARQVPNPVALFAADNNGVVIDLPAVPPAGALTVAGTLTFGIGTQANNALGNATVLTLNAQTGNLVTVLNGQTLANSFIDSGSSALFFGRTAFALCSGVALGLYCPPATQTQNASNRGANGSATTVTFDVANANALFTANPTFNAFNNLAAPNPDASSFGWGLPFFYGRRVYTAFEGRATPGGTGPYVAY